MGIQDMLYYPRWEMEAGMDGWFANKGHVIQVFVGVASLLLALLVWANVSATKFFFLVPILLIAALLSVTAIIVNNIGLVIRLIAEVTTGIVVGVWGATWFYGHGGNLLISGDLMGPQMFEFQLNGPTLMSLGTNGSVVTVLGAVPLPDFISVPTQPTYSGGVSNPSPPAGASIPSPPINSSDPSSPANSSNPSQSGLSGVPSAPGMESLPRAQTTGPISNSGGGATSGGGGGVSNSPTPPTASITGNPPPVGNSTEYKRTAPLLLVIWPTW
jgi:hypothetical protein